MGFPHPAMQAYGSDWKFTTGCIIFSSGVERRFPAVPFPYVMTLTRNSSDQLFRVFVILRVMLNGMNHMHYPPV